MLLSNLYSRQPSKFYKQQAYQGSEFSAVPGYCCVDLGKTTHYGLGYLQIIGLSQPLYTFEIKGMVPWEFGDDIVGLMLKDYSNTTKIQSEMSDKNILKVLRSDNIPDGYEWADFVRAFRPGWYWTKAIKTGQIGESIANVEVVQRLVAGDQLEKVIKYAVSQGWDTAQELRSQASKWPG